MVLFLPQTQGPFPVGATTFAISINLANPDDRVVGNAKVRGTAAGHADKPALELEEIVFTAFYPANLDGGRTKKGLSWVPRPVGGMLRGYLHFGNFTSWYHSIVNWLLHIPAGLIKVPVYPNTPLLDPQDVPEFTDASWPLVFFSHGLAGNRTNYSHICSRLASQGKVVLAFEHRDGTGPFVETLSAMPGKLAPKHADYKLYLHPDDILWGDEVDKSTFPLRRDQLRFRRLELYLGYMHFKKLVEGVITEHTNDLPCPEFHTIDGPWNFNLGFRPADRHFWESWSKSGSRPKVRCDRGVCLAGHSFGGATVLDVLSNKPPTLSGEQFPPIPFTNAIAFDPWIDPLPSPGPAPHAPSVPGEQSSEPPKLLVINSEGFTLWEVHFNRLTEIVEAWNNAGRQSEQAGPEQEQESGKINKKRFSGPRASLLTLVRAQHTSFSDFGVLVPFGRYARDGRRFLSLTCDLAVAFLQEKEGRFEEVLGRQRQVEGRVEEINVDKPDSETLWKKRIVGEVGDIVVH
ncbi:platelet-activating factor acetylhydrolase [Cytidiella melzeri]|nr:platelet-activating factor acetylhydrolase [Cytidiella melzeri]